MNRATNFPHNTIFDLTHPVALYPLIILLVERFKKEHLFNNFIDLVLYLYIFFHYYLKFLINKYSILLLNPYTWTLEFKNENNNRYTAELEEYWFFYLKLFLSIDPFGLFTNNYLDALFFPLGLSIFYDFYLLSCPFLPLPKIFIKSI